MLWKSSKKRFKTPKPYRAASFQVKRTPYVRAQCVYNLAVKKKTIYFFQFSRRSSRTRRGKFFGVAIKAIRIMYTYIPHISRQRVRHVWTAAITITIK